MDAAESSTRHVEFCPLDTTLKLIDGKWKTIILCRLMDHDYRFTELLRTLSGCTRRMLALQLEQLEHDQIVIKTTDTNYVPTKTSYSLSKIGRSLVPLILALNRWGRAYLKEVQPVTLTSDS